MLSRRSTSRFLRHIHLSKLLGHTIDSSNRRSLSGICGCRRLIATHHCSVLMAVQRNLSHLYGSWCLFITTLGISSRILLLGEAAIANSLLLSSLDCISTGTKLIRLASICPFLSSAWSRPWMRSRRHSRRSGCLVVLVIWSFGTGGGIVAILGARTGRRVLRHCGD